MRNQARLVVTFIPARGVDGTHALCRLLESVRFRYGLVAVDVRVDAAPDVLNQIADSFSQLRHDVARRVAQFATHTQSKRGIERWANW